MALFQLIYTSTASAKPSDATLTEMLQGSRRRNRERGITGLILYHEHQFLQILEGEQSVVESLFEKIAGDPRHLMPTVIWRGAIESREFPDFAMAFRDLEAPPPVGLEGFSPVLVERIIEKGNAASRAHHFIRAFRRVTGID